MPEDRRWYVVRGTDFFTLVACNRRPILCSDPARGYLHEAIAAVQREWPLAWVAILLLPDHLHTVWPLPRGDACYPIRWKRITEDFTHRYLKARGEEVPLRRSRVRHAERAIWQRRYWEHAVEDEDDLKRCVDDAHWKLKKCQ